MILKALPRHRLSPGGTNGAESFVADGHLGIGEEKFRDSAKATPRAFSKLACFSLWAIFFTT
jgi:hypothetical protein